VRRVTLVAVGLAVILSASACAQSNPIAVAAPASQSPVSSVTGTMALRAQNLPGLGEVVVDGNGYALYRYDRDTAKPPKANCGIDCVMTWPPLIDTGDIRLEGVDRALVGNVVRTDFTKQVTIAGWPVYRYGGDTGPGVAKGEGVGGVWFAITPTGKKAVGGGGGADAANGNANTANGNTGGATGNDNGTAGGDGTGTTGNGN
jgi:predicted lipoprotein with Yx(FWY)xxD motif